MDKEIKTAIEKLQAEVKRLRHRIEELERVEAIGQPLYKPGYPYFPLVRG